MVTSPPDPLSLSKERGNKIKKEGLKPLLNTPESKGLRTKPQWAVLRLKDSSRRVGRKLY